MLRYRTMTEAFKFKTISAEVTCWFLKRFQSTVYRPNAELHTFCSHKNGRNLVKRKRKMRYRQKNLLASCVTPAVCFLSGFINCQR